MKTNEYVPCCPYCGSDKLISVDWGFADWECESCRNNFRSPVRKNYNIKTGSNHEYTSSHRISVLKIFEISLKLLLIICIIVSIMFFIIRFYQIFIMQFL